MQASDRLLLNQADMDPPELILWLGDASTLQRGHALISTKMDEWVPGPTRFDEHKAKIAKCLEDAAALKLETTDELEEAVSDAVEDITINANYLALRARHDKNDAWLHNSGHHQKEKPKRNYNKMVSMIASLLAAKNGPGMGEVTLSWDKDPAAGSYQLQICKGTPRGEDSWTDQGYFTKVRTVINNLERGGWYYFRVRSIGNNQTGPWSETVEIIVT